VRPFTLPARSVAGSDFFCCLREAALCVSGEHVKHCPTDGGEQMVVMHYQYIPEDANIGPEFKLSGTNPVLWGCAEHFEMVPDIFKCGNAAKPDKGSQFEVRGIKYDVKCVEIKHTGYIRIELVQSEKCATPRPEFEAEQEMQICGCFDLECEGDCGC
jgi:hypothetical protein